MLILVITLTSDPSCGRYLRHSISSLKTGMDSCGKEQQKVTIEDTSCMQTRKRMTPKLTIL